MAWGVALGVSSILECYLEGWGKTHRFYSNALPFKYAFCHICKYVLQTSRFKTI
jgi:hypothetical protein